MQMNLHCIVAVMSVKEPESMLVFPAAIRIRCRMWSCFWPETSDSARQRACTGRTSNLKWSLEYRFEALQACSKHRQAIPIEIVRTTA